MKDQSIGSAFDVERPAVVAAPALVGHQGIGLPLALTGRFQIGQGAFELGQGGGQPRQLCPRSLAHLGGLGGIGLIGGDGGLLLLQAGRFRLQSIAQLLDAGLLRLHVLVGGLGAALDGPDLGHELLGFIKELHVQGLAPALQLSGALGHGLGILGGQAGGLQRLGPGHRFGPAIDHQQQQDQRAHGAEQHREEWEGGHLQLLPALSHAAPFSVGIWPARRKLGPFLTSSRAARVVSR